MRQGLVYGGLAVLMGIGMVVLGGGGLASDVTCHGRKMAHDEQCFTIHRRTGAVSHDYAGQRSAQQRQSWVLLLIGVPLAAGGAVWFTASVRSRRANKPR